MPETAAVGDLIPAYGFAGEDAGAPRMAPDD